MGTNLIESSVCLGSAARKFGIEQCFLRTRRSVVTRAQTDCTLARVRQAYVIVGIIAFTVGGACSLDEAGTGPLLDAGVDIVAQVDASEASFVDVVADVVEDEAAPPPSPASPGDLDAGVPLIMWVRADSIVLNDGGTTIAALPDMSPSGNDVTQAAAIQQPTWTAQNASFNNNPTVHFTQTQSLGNTTVTVTQPATVFIVANAQSNISYFYDSADPANRLALLSRSGSSGFPVSMYSTGGSYAPTFGTGNVQPPAIVISLFTGTSSAIFVSSDVTVGPLVIVPGAKAVGITLGNFYGGTYGLQGDLAEYAIFGGALNLPDIQRLNAYASQRYNIKLN